MPGTKWTEAMTVQESAVGEFLEPLEIVDNWIETQRGDTPSESTYTRFWRDAMEIVPNSNEIQWGDTSSAPESTGSTHFGCHAMAIDPHWIKTQEDSSSEITGGPLFEGKLSLAGWAASFSIIKAVRSSDHMPQLMTKLQTSGRPGRLVTVEMVPMKSDQSRNLSEFYVWDSEESL